MPYSPANVPQTRSHRSHASAKINRDRYISDDEYTRLIEAASPTLRVIINMAYLTGQRIGDVLKIKQSDISPDGITVIQEKLAKNSK